MKSLLIEFYSVFKLGVTASAIGMVFIQYERCSHVKILLLLYRIKSNPVVNKINTQRELVFQRLVNYSSKCIKLVNARPVSSKPTLIITQQMFQTLI